MLLCTVVLISRRPRRALRLSCLIDIVAYTIIQWLLNLSQVVSSMLLRADRSALERMSSCQFYFSNGFVI